MIGGITRKHWAVNIRKFLPRYRRLAQLVATGTLPPHVAERLSRAMRHGDSILVSGATHAGKTTMLAALIAECAPHQRIITVEETFELMQILIAALRSREQGGREVPLAEI